MQKAAILFFSFNNPLSRFTVDCVRRLHSIFWKFCSVFNSLFYHTRLLCRHSNPIALPTLLHTSVPLYRSMLHVFFISATSICQVAVVDYYIFFFPPPPVPLFILLDHVFSVEENFRKYLPERGDNNRWVISINSLNWLKSTCQFDATLMTLGLVINFTDYPPANASNRKQDVNEGGFDSLCSDTSKPDKTIACHI